MQFVVTLRPFLTFANIAQPFCEVFEEDLTSNLASQLEEQYRSLSKSSLAWIIGKKNVVTTDEIIPVTLTTQMRGWIREYAPRKKILAFSVEMKFRLAAEAGMIQYPRKRRPTLTEKLIAQALEIHLDDSVCVSTIHRNNSLVSSNSTSDETSQRSKAITDASTSHSASNSEEAQASAEEPCDITSACNVNYPLIVRLPALEETGNLPEAEATTQYIIAAAQGETPEEFHTADKPIGILDDGIVDNNNINMTSDVGFLQYALPKPSALSAPPSKLDFSAPTTAIGNAPDSDLHQNQYVLNPILINHGLHGLDRGDNESMLDVQEERPLFQSLDGNVHDYFDCLASYHPHEYVPDPFPDQLEIAWHGGPPSSFEAYLRNAVVREEEEMMN